MSVARPAPPIFACRRIADDTLVLHVIDHGVCAAVTLSRRRALQLVHDLLVAAVPDGAPSAAARPTSSRATSSRPTLSRPASPRPVPSRPRRAGGRR